MLVKSPSDIRANPLPTPFGLRANGGAGSAAAFYRDIVPRAALLAALLGAAPAAAQVVPRTEYEEVTGRPKPLPAIPRAFSGFVRAASPDLLLVRGLGGRDISVEIDWYEVEGFEQLQGGRFLGFAVTGHEAYGYILVDRAAAAGDAVHHTGARPTFSPDGRWFAAAEMSDAGFGNLHGVALWEVRREGTFRRFYTDALPYGSEWRVDRWVRPRCVSVSAIGAGWGAPPGADPEAAARAAPRTHYSLEIQDGGIDMTASNDRPGCTGDGQ
ncbi:MAG TPA: hypothetical protein VEZ20_00950 [Allosphingosinicella sp.]|nr:hypothetical protein [Allosphingosinicella sp.]